MGRGALLNREFAVLYKPHPCGTGCDVTAMQASRLPPGPSDANLEERHQPAYLFCFCLSLSFFEEEPRCCPFSSSSPAAFNTLPCTDVGSLAMRGATSHTPLRSEELKSETGVTPENAAVSALTANAGAHRKPPVRKAQTSRVLISCLHFLLSPKTRHLLTLYTHIC